MQPTSQAYKTEQKQQLREKSYVWVYLGVVDRYAQKSAKIDNSTPVTEWSKVPTGNDRVEGVYATYEQNFFRADGSMRFPPEGVWGMYQGAASVGIGGSIKFTFGSLCNISGVSLKFYEDAVPTRFTITNGTVSNTYTYSELELDDAGRCKCQGVYENSPYIMISPYDSSSLKGGNQRFRIQQILFGLGFYFDNKDLLSTSFTNTVSHLSDQLPSKKFSFTIGNTSKKFSADDPHSFVHFLQEQQEVEFDYGRDLPGGGIETIKGGKLYLKTWSTDDQKATFDAVGRLEFMDGTYYKGQIYPAYYTLHDIAEMVLQDAGITEYHLDDSLSRYLAFNPLPVEKHKNLLQLIANAGRCIFYEDREGILTIAPAYEGTVENATDYTLEYKDLLKTPDASTTEFVKNVVCQYYYFEKAEKFSQVGTLERDNVKVGENFLLFNDPMHISDVYYEDSPVTGSEDFMRGDDVDIHGGEYIEINIEDGYVSIDGSLYESEGYYSSLDGIDQFTITLYDTNGTVIKQETETNRLYYQNPNPYDPTSGYLGCWIKVEYDTYRTATITERGAYYIKFTADHQSRILFWGQEVTVHTYEANKQIPGRSIGVDKTCKNILISWEDWAEDNLDWMVDYYDDDIEYTLDYRGEPALDCDDVFYLDSEFVSKNYVRLVESTINTSQGMTKSTMKARRSSWKDFGRVDYAIVDGSEVK